MAVTWSNLRERVRRTILKDEQKRAFTDPVLLDACWMALLDFAAHTAVATATSFYPATGTTYDLPDNLYESLELSGRVYISQNSSGRVAYLEPSRMQALRKSTANVVGTFFQWEQNRLELSGVPPADHTLWIRYYAHYNRPYADSDLIEIPGWSETAIMYLIGAHALTGRLVSEASVGRFKSKEEDAGQPEQQSTRVLQKYLFEQYECELRRHPRQNRSTAFRAT